MCIYDNCLFYFKKKKIFFISAADTIRSCTEAVDELFQHTMGYDYMEHDVNTIAACVYMSIAYSAKKKQILIIVAADTICSCTEAVDEQFQDILGSECMQHGLFTWIVQI